MNRLEQAIREAKETGAIHLKRNGERIATIWPDWWARNISKKEYADQFEIEYYAAGNDGMPYYLVTIKTPFSQVTFSADSWEAL